MKLHPLSWLIWVGAAAVCSLLIHNPLYHIILALSAWLVLLTAGTNTPFQGGWLGVIRLGALIWAITIPFNALMLHQGEIVLFRLPSQWPLVGGNITLEAVIYGASTGLAVWVLLVLFSTFNTVMDASELLRTAPPVFYQASVITSIGLTFVPQMVKSSQEIREAQRVRGHRYRSWKDMLPLVMPLLTTSLERAMMLAESMEARGFGSETEGSASSHLEMGFLIVLGLGLLLVGVAFRLWWPGAWWASLLIVCALGCLAGAFISLARHSKRSHYRRQRWLWSDTFVTASSLAAVTALIFIRITSKQMLTYYPFPPNSLLPIFHPATGLVCLLFAAPGLLSLLHEALRPVESDHSFSKVDL